MHKLIAPIILLTAGCSGSPAYERPAFLPNRASGEFLVRSQWVDPLAPLPDRWWRLYNDNVLDTLIARAFAANADIRVAVANLERARAFADEVRDGRKPATGINGGVSYGKGVSTSGQGGSLTGGLESRLSFRSGASLSWELDLFGRVKSTIAAATADVETTEALRDAVRTTVAAETARAYLASCALSETAKIFDESINNGQKTLESTMARVRVGNAAALDVDRTVVDIESTRAAKFDIEGQRQVALFELGALIGEPPGQLPAGAAICQALPELSRPIPIETVGALVKRRPDIRAAERQLAANTARIGVATAELYPQFSLVGSAGYYGDRSAGRNSLFSFSFGPLFSWSFPNQGIARARIRQADAQAQASLAQFDGKVLSAMKEVEQQLARYTAERSRSEALAEARDRAERAFQKVSHRNRAGAISFLDVLVAQRQLIEARSSYANSRERLTSRQIDLFRALGGGWEEETAGDKAKITAAQ